MRFASVCSGIEAASVAWHPLGWSTAFVSEIDPFASAVLAHRFPSTPNHGDMTRFQEWPDAAFNLLVGGTPCQSFSVAGLRGGLADPRGNLMLTYGAIAARYRPAWLVWENVPGVLSSNGGRDFGAFLGMLGELGYGFAYRVLDAQYFGLAQRRKRVFVVGCLGSWQRAAAVLFERAGFAGHPAPSRQARQDVAGTVRASAGKRGGIQDQSGAEGLIARCVTTGEGKRQDYETCTLIAHSLRGEGFDASEDGTGRGTPLVPVNFQASQSGVRLNDTAGTLDATIGDVAPPLKATMQPAVHASGGNHNERNFNADASQAGPIEALRALRHAVGEEEFCVWCLGILAALQPTQVLQRRLHGTRFRVAAFSRSWMVDRALSREKGGSAWLLQSLREVGCAGCPPSGWQPSEQLDRELGAYLSELSQPGAQAARFVRDLWQSAKGAGLLREALSAAQEVGEPTGNEAQPAHGTVRIRRLTVEECEFLQGFPRGYTAIPYRGKPAADGPRYKALGNSMAVPVMQWIGRRIAAVDAIREAV